MNKLFIQILISCLFLSCRSNNSTEWFECEKEKELYTIEKVIPIDLDTFETLKHFNDFADKIADTISNCGIVYGFVYNLENLSLTPNIDSSKNIIIPGLMAWNPNCGCEMPKPKLSIFLTSSDTIQIIELGKDTAEFLYSQNELITKYFAKYYEQKTKVANSYQEFNDRWIHVCIKDTFYFKTKFLPVFNSLFSIYNKELKQFILKKYKKSFCQLDTSATNDMIKSRNRFRIWVDNFDFRNPPDFFNQK